MLESDKGFPEAEALPQSCWHEGLACQKVPVVGGVTLSFLVKRDQEGGAPLLVMVYHFPAERCVRCGEETTNGTLAAAFERELQARFQRGEPIPAEIDFHPVAA
jgi:hypothetical protein